MLTARRIATVFGGSGFLGRHVVQHLAEAGYTVRVAVRDTEAAKFLRPMGDIGQVVPLGADVTDEAACARAVSGAELAVNLVGILAERRRGEFIRIHEQGAAVAARCAAAAGVKSLVHVSALGADAQSPSAYARSKAGGEAAVRAAFPNAAILRPSVMFGPEDDFFNRFAAMAVSAPVIPIVHGGTKLQPVYVRDVAQAVLAASLRGQGRVFELGGPEVKSLRELVTLTLACIGRHKPVIELPAGFARLLALVLERVPGKPLTRDQIALLARDNVVSEGAPDLAGLGIAATAPLLVLPLYLNRFRPGAKGLTAIYQE